MSELGLDWDKSLKNMRNILNKLSDTLPDVHHLLLGNVGKLTFDAQYRREKADLEARWTNLPDRPPLPLNGNVADRPPTPIASIDPYRNQVLGEQLERFLVDFGRFMRKWRIMGCSLFLGPLEMEVFIG